MDYSVPPPISPSEREKVNRQYKEMVLEKKRLKLEKSISRLHNASESANNTTVVSSRSISKPQFQLEDTETNSFTTPIKFVQSFNPSQVHSPPAGGPPASPLFKSTPMSTPIQNRRSLRQRTLQFATEQQQQEQQQLKQQQKNKIGNAKKRILKQIDEEERAEKSNNAGSNKGKILKQPIEEAKEDEKSKSKISSKKIKVDQVSSVANVTLIHSMEVLGLNKSNIIEIEVNKEKPEMEMEVEEHEKSKIAVDIITVELENNDKSFMKTGAKAKISSPATSNNSNRKDVENINENETDEDTVDEGEKNMIKFLKEEELIKYKKFKNFDRVNYQMQEINDQKMNIYSIKDENHKFNESYPGVLSSRVIDKKIAYFKIEPKTSRPFEFKNNANLFFTVIEGSVVFKSQELTTDSKSGVKCLQSVKISPGESFFVPARTIYCLINIDETEAQLVLFMEKTTYS